MKLKSFLFSLLFLSNYFSLFGQEKLYFNQTDFGISIGNTVSYWGEESTLRKKFTFSTFHGAKFHPSHAVGFSVGVDDYDQMTLVPVAIGWRGFSKSSWFAGLDVGYGSTIFQKTHRNEWMESWNEGGVMISPTIGLRKESKNGKNHFSWTLGFKRQEASFFEGTIDRFPTQTPEDAGLPRGFSALSENSYVFNSLFLRWGMMF